MKNTKYQPLIDSIKTKEWNVVPLVILTTNARATIHIPSMKNPKIRLKFLATKIKNTCKQTNTIATQYAHFILVYKRRLEN